MAETIGMLNTRTGEYDFIGRSIPIFPQNDLDVPAGEKAYIKVKAPFCDKLSGMICTKFFGRSMVKAFREVKLRLTNPPVLHLPKAEGRFILYSDTRIEGTGSSLWQIQEGKPRLIGYASKTLPEACSRYSAELEMTGLLVNMNLWKNSLKHREFDAAVDHVAVAQIMKAKTEPATTRIMRLLDRLSAYSFNLYYVKGRDIILSDYLSRHRQKDLDPSELIPISFCCLEVYRGYIDDKIGEDIFCVKTRSSAKVSGEEVGEVHGANKPLDPNYTPEHQSKSKLPSVTGRSSPVKKPSKPILKMPARPTPKVLTPPKSVKKSQRLRMTCQPLFQTPLRWGHLFWCMEGPAKNS